MKRNMKQMKEKRKSIQSKKSGIADQVANHTNDAFDLYDLKVVVHHDGVKPMVCNHPVGSYFTLSGENLSIPNGSTFPIYSLSAILPLLPAKQRETHPNDWMSTDMNIACPDPNCGGIFRIERQAKRQFFHHQVTVTPLVNKPNYKRKKAI